MRLEPQILHYLQTLHYLRQQLFPKPTPRRTTTMGWSCLKRKKNLFSDGAHSPSINTTVLSLHCDHPQVSASFVINIISFPIKTKCYTFEKTENENCMINMF